MKVDDLNHNPSVKAFGLLHRKVQEELYRMAWKELRPLQVRSIGHILTTDRHAVLCAATASGKTEAAFLPIISTIANEPSGFIRALYVSPLKALINDQFQRLGDLCERLGLAVNRWHGDVAASTKKTLIKNPPAILLITPESLESLFVNRADHIDALFCGLGFVVIDEMHSFIAVDRGTHLRSLLGRLRGLSAGSVRLFGLSATIGDPEVACQYLSGDEPERVDILSDDGDTKELKMRIHCYLDRNSDAACEEGDSEVTSPVRHAIAQDMLRHCGSNTNLVFGNRKADVEEFSDLCQRSVDAGRIGPLFAVHHGSLSASIRDDAETLLKYGRNVTVFCSSTLEMGIDIGSVTMIGQIGAPSSVSSLTQRLGRSGRKAGDPRILRMYLELSESRPEQNIFSRLHLEMLQTVAVSELLLGGWTEPLVLPACDLSTLAHQIISVVAQHGGASASALYQTLCHPPTGAFTDVEVSLFTRLLRSLAEYDVIEQMANGEITLGLRGEQLRNDRSFYAVFETPQVYSLFHQAVRLGELQTIPEIHDYLLFAGRRWQVESVDADKREIYVIPAKGWRRPRFFSDSMDVHQEVRRKMRSILGGGEVPRYLDETGLRMLTSARRAANEAGLGYRSIIELGGHSSAILTWTGSRVQRTISAIFQSAGIIATDREVGFLVDLDVDRLRDKLGEICNQRFEPIDIARFMASKRVRKYDRFIDEDLLDIGIARSRISIGEAHEVLREVLAHQ